MTYRLEIVPNSAPYSIQWANFATHITLDRRELWTALAEDYNGWNIHKTACIGFETEEDAMMFVLRWAN